ADESHCDPHSKVQMDYAKQPTEEIPAKQQEWSSDVWQDEPGPSEVKEEETQELWLNGSDEQPVMEDSDDGDALTKELIKTVQQLEDCRAAEESREPSQTSSDEQKLLEEKTSTTLYRCHICNYIFTKKTVLTWHLKTHESKPQESKSNFDCHICGKHIPCQSNLQNHMRVHTGERPYSCHYCGKCFKLKGHMTEHIRTHTGEKPFSCHICGKSFNRGSTLRKHVLAKHKEERPYKCGDCDELFTERLLMKSDNYTHKISPKAVSAPHMTPYLLCQSTAATPAASRLDSYSFETGQVSLSVNVCFPVSKGFF
uniref:C2H2-type domain-containing protein n=1 Tax=Amphilophus citrinellus TaxID=61819 RepID=A0A3Q0QY34_AMPCI